MIITSLKPPTLALDEFLILPETEPASEYIDGQIYQKPMPQGKHSTLQIRLATLINQIAEAPKLAFAFPELRCVFADRAIVPDIAVLRWGHIPLDESGEPENKIDIPPDWLIEILSPEQSPLFLIEKIDFAIKHGTELGWLIAPAEKKILTFARDNFNYHQGSDILPVLAVLGNWQITVDQVFCLLKFS